MKKTKGKKSLPTKRQSPPQPLLDAGNPHKIRGSGEFNKQGSVVGHGFHDFPYMVNNVGSQI